MVEPWRRMEGHDRGCCRRGGGGNLYDLSGSVEGGVNTMKLLLKDFPVALLARESAGVGEGDA